MQSGHQKANPTGSPATTTSTRHESVWTIIRKSAAPFSRSKPQLWANAPWCLVVPFILPGLLGLPLKLSGLSISGVIINCIVSINCCVEPCQLQPQTFGPTQYPTINQLYIHTLTYDICWIVQRKQIFTTWSSLQDFFMRHLHNHLGNTECWRSCL